MNWSNERGSRNGLLGFLLLATQGAWGGGIPCIRPLYGLISSVPYPPRAGSEFNPIPVISLDVRVSPEFLAEMKHRLNRAKLVLRELPQIDPHRLHPLKPLKISDALEKGANNQGLFTGNLKSFGTSLDSSGDPEIFVKKIKKDHALPLNALKASQTIPI